MNEFKYQFVNFLLLALLGFGIYWAFNTIDNGIVYDKKDRVVLNEEISDIQALEKEVAKKEEVVLFDNTQKPALQEVSAKETLKPEKTLSASEKALLVKLEDLIKDDIYMKKGSKGTRVGTVQKFLNIYFKTTKTVDNQYGSGTLADVKKFQEAESLDADGQAGPDTYKKMISILKK